MKHSFDIEIAKKYGIEIAVILDNIIFWTAKNKANNKHFYDGKYWTYNSARAFNELFPYFNQIKIKRLLQKMKDENLIFVGNYNKNHYDRTNWYAINEKLITSIVQNSTIDGIQNDIMHGSEMTNVHGSKMTNGSIKNDQPIPYVNTDNKIHIINNKETVVVENENDIKEKPKTNKEAEIEDFFLSLWDLYLNKKSKTKVSKESKKKIYAIGLEHMQRAILRYRKEVENIESKFIKHGSTFFNTGYIDYLDENYTQECNLNFKFNGDDEIISNFNEYVKMKRKEYRNLLLKYNNNDVDIMIDRLNDLKEKGEKINKNDYDWILEKLQVESVKAI